MTMPAELEKMIEAFRVKRGLKTTAAAHRALLTEALATIDHNPDPLVTGIYDEARRHVDFSKAMLPAKLSEIEVQPLSPGPSVWPSGAVVLPEHTEDPGPSAPVRVHVPLKSTREFNPQPKPGKK